MLVIRKVAVLGAGVMGAQIAAHMINADVPVILFDMPAVEGERNALVQKAIQQLKKLKPAPLGNSDKADLIVPANYAENLDKLKECDLIIEAVAERMDIKLDLYQKIAPYIGEKSALVSNTSGLSIEALAKILPEKHRSRFCGVHFFNPPRYMQLVELIPHANMDPALLPELEKFLSSRLGKGVVHAKDTPNFIANRVGVFSLLATLHHAEKFGIPLEVVDALTGPLLGRPKSATFRTMDVVGLDTFAHVVNTLTQNLPHDPWAKYYVLPEWLQNLITSGALGQKTGRGIYDKKNKEIDIWDIATQQYRPADKTASADVIQILKISDPQKRFAALAASQHPEAQFIISCLRDLFHYCAVHLEEIAHSVRDVDQAIRWGFGWRQGPFELWQSIGWHAVSDWLEIGRQAGLTMSDAVLPTWVRAQTVVYAAEGAYSPQENKLMGSSELAVYQRQYLTLAEKMPLENPDTGITIFETPGVRVWHENSADKIAVLSFKTKNQTINDAVLDGIFEAVKIAEKDFLGLVIWQPDQNFSFGANLAEADLNNVGAIVAKFQRAALALRYAGVPVVAAVRGLTLGGGCELALHCARIVAAFETYIGLPEVGVGLLPAGGGCKEFALRAFQEARGDDPYRDLQQYFKQIAMGEVSTSAEEAKLKGYLRPSDIVVMNSREILWVARQQALALSAHYRPPLRPRIAVVGMPGIANFTAMLVNMRAGQFISEHDYFIAQKVAHTLCGGDLPAGTLVDEEWFLRLEREAFVELAKTEKSQARIAHMLKTGKPLRN